MKSLNPKFILSFLFFVFISTCFTSCYVHHPRHRTVVVKHRHLPPGQAKKIYGDRSAKRYAPGQRKKHRNHDDNNNQ